MDMDSESHHFKPWLNYVPKRIFTPELPGFNNDFLVRLRSHMQNTRAYYYRGVSARVTTTQLYRLLPKLANRSLNEIKLLLLAPERRSLEASLGVGNIDLASGRDDRVQSMTEEFFTTLHGLEKINELAPRIDIKASIFREDAYYRLELTDPAVYVTYYLQDRTTSTVVYWAKDLARLSNGKKDDQHEDDSPSMYATHRKAFETAFNYASKNIVICSTPDNGTEVRLGAESVSIADYIRTEAANPVGFYVDLWNQRLNDIPDVRV